MPELNVEKYKKLVSFITTNFKALETELLIYRAAFAGLKVVDPSQSHFLDLTLQTARNSSAIQKVMNDKYDAALEQFLKQLDASAQEEDLLKWMQNWKPETPVN